MPSYYHDTKRGHVDATTPIAGTVLQSDVPDADPLNPAACASAAMMKRTHGFAEFIVYLTIAYGRMPGEEKYTRWEVSPKARLFLEMFDINKPGTKKRIPPEGLHFVFHPMRESLKHDYLRSPKRLKKMREAKIRNKGKPKRKYNRSLLVRWATIQKT